MKYYLDAMEIIVKVHKGKVHLFAADLDELLDVFVSHPICREETLIFYSYLKKTPKKPTRYLLYRIV